MLRDTGRNGEYVLFPEPLCRALQTMVTRQRAGDLRIGCSLRYPFGTRGPFTGKMGQGCQLHLKLLASNEAPSKGLQPFPQLLQGRPCQMDPTKRARSMK
jgi:hypothetical protein